MSSVKKIRLRFEWMNKNIKQIAYERIYMLFTLAKQIARERPDLADRYVDIARRIAMKARVHLPKEFRLLVCRRCKRFILPGVSSRVRVQPRREPHVTITCLHCGNHMRIPCRRRKKGEYAH